MCSIRESRNARIDKMSYNTSKERGKGILNIRKGVVNERKRGSI